jgi:hypothetical protein
VSGYLFYDVDDDQFGQLGLLVKQRVVGTIDETTLSLGLGPDG